MTLSARESAMTRLRDEHSLLRKREPRYAWSYLTRGTYEDIRSCKDTLSSWLSVWLHFLEDWAPR